VQLLAPKIAVVVNWEAMLEDLPGPSSQGELELAGIGCLDTDSLSKEHPNFLVIA